MRESSQANCYAIGYFLPIRLHRRSPMLLSRPILNYCRHLSSVAQQLCSYTMSSPLSSLQLQNSARDKTKLRIKPRISHPCGILKSSLFSSCWQHAKENSYFLYHSLKDESPREKDFDAFNDESFNFSQRI